MTKTWEEIEAGLTSLLSRISALPKSMIASVGSGVAAGSVGARDGNVTFPMTKKLAQIEFAIVSVLPLGTDEERSHFDPNAIIQGDISGPGGTPQNGGVIYEVCGNRTWTIEISIECWDLKKGPDYARACHDRISLPSARAELAALGLPLSGIGDLNDASYEDEEGRAVSLFIFEITCNGSTVVVDEPVTTIETVDTHVTVDGEEIT